MDLRQYFRKLREIENSLVDAYPVVISLETSDGGRAGVVSEVSRETAAKLIIEGRAILASEEQKKFLGCNSKQLRRVPRRWNWLAECRLQSLLTLISRIQ